MRAITTRPSPELPRSPERLFPLIRHLSWRVTPLLIRLGLSANVVTFTSLISGLAAGGLFAVGQIEFALGGCFAFFLAYLLDNCDGEVARATGKQSDLGARLDDLADWLGDAAFFAGLGVGTARAMGDDIWMWFGLAAAAGGTIDSVIKFLRSRAGQPSEETTVSDGGIVQASRVPKDKTDWAFLFFQKLSRADFWLIVLILTVSGYVWILLPLGAVGAQIYWITGLSPRAHGWKV